MFEEAIEIAAAFTRPVHSILRTFGSQRVMAGAATLFFVNDVGCAITCKHVVELLRSSEGLNQRYQSYRAEKNASGGAQQAQAGQLELKYQYNLNSIIQAKHKFLDCVDSLTSFTSHVHPLHDLAIIRFEGYKSLHYQRPAVFVKDASRIRQGGQLCRLGFPFPEFTNFRYNEQTDDIEWTNEGLVQSPRFPMDGMVTRFLVQQHNVYGIELSTPGLRGQSGGPLFDRNGIVCGMQFATRHLHLGFDMIDTEIVSNNEVKKVTDYSFMHLGQCIHVDVIKDFLREHGIRFLEE